MNDLLKEQDFQPKKGFQLSYGEAIIAALLTMMGQVIGGFLTVPAIFFQDLMGVLTAAGFVFGFVLSIFFLFKWKDLNMAELKKWLKISPKLFPFILAIALYFAVIGPVEHLITLIPTDGIFEPLYEFFIEQFEAIFQHKISAFIMMCILAPILEEVVFRGFILRGMLQKGIAPILAIIISGLIFGAAHINPWQFLGASILGMTFGYVFYLTRSLWLCMLLHAINNIMSFVLVMNTESMETSVFNFNTPQMILSIAGIFIFGYLLYRFTKKPISWS